MGEPKPVTDGAAQSDRDRTSFMQEQGRGQAQSQPRSWFNIYFDHPDLMSQYKDLLKQRAELDRLIEELRQRENGEALEKVRALVTEFGLTADDVFGRQRKASGPVAAKYRDNATGATWSGRGKPPRWLAGKDRNDYLIA